MRLAGESILEFGNFYGNDQLKKTLSEDCAQSRFAHLYLLAGPQGSGKHTLALRLAAAMLCEAAGERPCGRCVACRKVFSGSHPDVITVDDTEKKTVPVDLIRKMREDLFVRPNEGRRKIYILPRAQDLGLSAQNALLKVLEEPPAYGAFLLLADNAEKLLPTVRSRCTELRLMPLEKKLFLKKLREQFPEASEEQCQSAYLRSGGFLGQGAALLRSGGQLEPQTESFAQAYAGRNQLELLRVFASMEKCKREQLLALLGQWREVLLSSLSYRAGAPAENQFSEALCRRRTAAELSVACCVLERAMQYAQGNVSVGAICGDLFWKLR